MTLPVEENLQNLYRCAHFCPTRQGKPAKPLRVDHFSLYPSRKPGKTSTGPSELTTVIHNSRRFFG